MDNQLMPYKNIQWQYAATLTFTDRALRSLNSGRLSDPSHLVYVDFVRKIAAKMHIRVGALSVCVWESPAIRPHVHLLLVGYSRSGKSLATRNPSKIEEYWQYGSATVSPVTDIDGALEYLALNERSGGTGYNFHGQRLLQRLLEED